MQLLNIFKKKEWHVVGVTAKKNLWTVSCRKPQVLCRLLLLQDQFGNRDYELEMLDDAYFNYNSLIRYQMINQYLPVEYISKFVKGWSVGKINEIHGERVFEERYITREKFTKEA